MAKKIKSKNIRAGDKVILFQPSRLPCIAWVCAGIFGPTIYKSGKDKYMVKVTRYEDEAIAGKGQHISSVHIQPFTEELWGACDEWFRRGAKLDSELETLKKGKIPIDYEKERVA